MLNFIKSPSLCFIPVRFICNIYSIVLLKSFAFLNDNAKNGSRIRLQLKESLENGYKAIDSGIARFVHRLASRLCEPVQSSH